MAIQVHADDLHHAVHSVTTQALKPPKVDRYDPDRYENPEEFRLEREGRDIGFGGGRNYCPGVNLAKAVLTTRRQLSTSTSSSTGPKPVLSLLWNSIVDVRPNATNVATLCT